MRSEFLYVIATIRPFLESSGTAVEEIFILEKVHKIT